MELSGALLDKEALERLPDAALNRLDSLRWETQRADGMIECRRQAIMHVDLTRKAKGTVVAKTNSLVKKRSFFGLLFYERLHRLTSIDEANVVLHAKVCDGVFVEA